eukprot:GEMP01001565.1.p1 GENE.GEMP01001565.1~~GEMP01001565.1.p1  ORF type:complete len:667 (+),score=120.37 GEMP01001565.1:104-2104(+)
MDTSTSSARDDEESPSESTIRRLRSPPSPVRRQAIQSGANTGDQFIPEEETNSVIAAAEGTPLHDAESPRRPLSPASCSMLHSGAQSGRSENDVDGRGQFVHQGIHAAGGLIRTPCYDVHGYRHAQPLASPCKRHNATQSGETGHRISGQFDGSMSGASAAELDEGDVRRGTSASWQEMQEPLRNFAQDEEAAARQHGPCNDAASSHGGAESVEKNEMLFFNAVECGTARSTRPRRRSSGAGRILSAFGVRCALRTDDSQVNGMEVEPVNDEGRSLTTMSGSVSIASLLVNVGMIMEPYALAQCGLALGVLVLTLVSFVILFNSFLMRRTLAICDALGEQNADLCVFAELAFGERGKKLVTAVFLMDLWAAQLTYYVIIAQCLRNFDESTETPLVVSGLLTVAMLHAPLSWISSFQKIGGLSIVTLLLALFFSGLSLETWPDPTYTNFTWRNVPSASSMMVFAYGNLAVLPTLLDRIPEKKRTRSIFWGVFASFALYGSAAAFCYLSYGDGVAASFLSNVGKDRRGKRLPGMAGSVLPVLSCILFAIKLQLSFPLLAAPSVHSICDLLQVKRRNILVSVMFVSTTVMSAYILRDHLAVLAAILGSLVTVPLVMLFPTTLYWRLAPRISIWTKLAIVGEFFVAFILAAVNLQPIVPLMLSTVYSVLA